MFKFAEGACVAIKNDNLALGLTAGETGKIWALYDTQPPAYEVAFRTQDGDEFDALMYEDELDQAAAKGDSAAVFRSRRPSPALAEPCAK